jgi:hypothetical protein
MAQHFELYFVNGEASSIIANDKDWAGVWDAGWVGRYVSLYTVPLHEPHSASGTSPCL